MGKTDYRYDGDDPVKDVYNAIVKVIFIVVAITAAGLLICSFFSSCSTPRGSSYIEQHRVERMMDRMDSVISAKTVIQQDSAWRESIMRQFESIREKSDTSHTLVVDTAGNVIREKIIINNIRETTSETDRREREWMIHRMEVMDSTMNIMRQQLSTTDSLLRSREDTNIKEVEKDLSWWQNMRLWLGNLVLIALAVAAVVWAVKKKFPFFTRIFRN